MKHFNLVSLLGKEDGRGAPLVYNSAPNERETSVFRYYYNFLKFLFRVRDLLPSVTTSAAIAFHIQLLTIRRIVNSYEFRDHQFWQPSDVYLTIITVSHLFVKIRWLMRFHGDKELCRVISTLCLFRFVLENSHRH